MKIQSNLIKKLRLTQNWSQEQLSEACGLGLRTIQRLENGGNASMQSVEALAAAFEVDPNEFNLIEKNESLTPVDAVKMGFLKFANFSDTATRFEYWWFFLFVLLVTAVAAILHEKASQIVTVILLLPFIAVGTRRLNDVGYSGWWQLLFLVPFGQIALFFMLAQESKESLDMAR